MSLISQVSSLATAMGTQVKSLRVMITGSSQGTLASLTTTDKSSVAAAINELNAKSAPAAVAATETAAGVAEIATQAETNAATDDARIVTPLKLKGAGDLWYQPLDSDLTAIAAIATTSYGRAFLALANQAGLQALLGLDTDVALVANSDTKIATQKAVKAYVDGALDANNAYQYKGGIDASATPNYPAASAGWTYKITAAGKIGGAAGIPVEIGDTITCLVDGTAAGTQAAVGANWLVMQTNIDGAVVGPVSSTAGAIATFSGTTGKVVQDSAVVISIDGTMVGNSDGKVPTEKAIRTYLAANYFTQTQIGDVTTDFVAQFNAALA